MDFSNISQWNLIMDSSKSAILSGGSIIEKISNFEPDHTFTSGTGAVLVTVVFNRGLEWYKAGDLQQYFAAPLGLSGLALGESKRIRLFTPTLFKMNNFNSGYKISFEVPKYFEDCTFKLWEFTGVEETGTIDQIAFDVNAIKELIGG